MECRQLFPSKPSGNPHPNSPSLAQKIRRASNGLYLQRAEKPPSVRSCSSAGSKSTATLESQFAGKHLTARRPAKQLTLAQATGRQSKATIAGPASRGLRHVQKMRSKGKTHSLGLKRGGSFTNGSTAQTSMGSKSKLLQRQHSAPSQSRQGEYEQGVVSGTRVRPGSAQSNDRTTKNGRRPHSAHAGSHQANSGRIETIFEKERLRPKSAHAGSAQSSRASNNTLRSRPRSAEVIRHSPMLGKGASQTSVDGESGGSPRRVRPQSADATGSPRRARPQSADAGSRNAERDSDMVLSRAPRPHSAHAETQISRDKTRLDISPHRSNAEAASLVAQFDIQRHSRISDCIGRVACASVGDLPAHVAKTGLESKASTPQQTPRDIDISDSGSELVMNIIPEVQASTQQQAGAIDAVEPRQPHDSSDDSPYFTIPPKSEEHDVGDAMQHVDPVSQYHGFHVRGPSRKKLTKYSRFRPHGDRLWACPPWDVMTNRMWLATEPATPQCKDDVKRWPRGGRNGWLGQTRHCPVAIGRGTGKDRMAQVTEREDHHFHATGGPTGVVGSTTLPETTMCLGQPTLAANLAVLHDAFRDSAVASALIMKQDVLAEDMIDEVQTTLRQFA